MDFSSTNGQQRDRNRIAKIIVGIALTMRFEDLDESQVENHGIVSVYSFTSEADFASLGLKINSFGTQRM
jgi:hypothetical protein